MKITIPEIDVLVESNGFWKGLVLKKHLIFDEAYTIANQALGVNMDLLIDDWRARYTEEGEDVSDEMVEFTSDIEGLLVGTTTWDSFTNRWTCDEGLEDICPAMFIQMINIAHLLNLL